MDFEEMMGRMAHSQNSCTPISEADIVGGFMPIEGLKPGDRVQLKGKEHACYSVIKEDDILTVFRLVTPPPTSGSGREYPCDFTALMTDGDESDNLLEFAFESRRFKLVK